VALAALAAALAGSTGSAGAATSCARWASSHGSDSAPGTAAKPFRTLARLVRALPDGGVGCLAGGSRFDERVVVTHPVSLVAQGGRATIAGGITVERTAAGSQIRGLTIHGGGRARAAVIVLADRVRVVANTIDGTGYRDKNTACVFLDGTRGAVVDGNRISSCTVATRRSLSAPGVFAGSAYGATISDNVILHTVGYGVVLGPNAQHSRVVHNLVDGSVGGVLIDGNAHFASSYDVVENNIFSNSGSYNVRAEWGGTVGKHNAVVSNCLWHGYGRNVSAPGVMTAGNVVADPRYAKRPSDYTVLGGPCLAKRPSILPAKPAALPRFTVHWVLIGLPTKVRVLSLRLTGVVSGSAIDVRCAARCSAHWRATARSGSVALPLLHGRWLAVGAALDVHVTHAGKAGAWARVTVTGTPKGMSVQHACLAPGGATPVSCGGFS
jgi:hypothetical protein